MHKSITEASGSALGALGTGEPKSAKADLTARLAVILDNKPLGPYLWAKWGETPERFKEVAC